MGDVQIELWETNNLGEEVPLTAAIAVVYPLDIRNSSGPDGIPTIAQEMCYRVILPSSPSPLKRFRLRERLPMCIPYPR